MEGHQHAHHRERMRNLFLTSGMDGFSDHNVLELLLFYSIPQKDTNVTAHNLINEFGSLKGVLDAPVELLTKVKGVGMYTATFLSMISQLTKRYYYEDARTKINCVDKQGVLEYIKTCFIGEAEECLYILVFSADGNFINKSKITVGNVSSVNIDKRAVVQTVIKNNAVIAVLAHNHPGGVAAPSADDIVATKDLARLLSEVGVTLSDHVIVAKNEAFSMAQNPKFGTLFCV